MSEQAPKKKTAARKASPAILVRCARPGGRFRRAGYDFTHDATRIDLADLSEEQVEHLRNEPMLVVEDIEE